MGLLRASDKLAGQWRLAHQSPWVLSHPNRAGLLDYSSGQPLFRESGTQQAWMFRGATQANISSALLTASPDQAKNLKEYNKS